MTAPTFAQAAADLNLMNPPTFAQAAADLNLWREWFDPDAVSDDEFHSMTIERRIGLLDEVYGDA